MNTKDLDYYTNSATQQLNLAVESYKPGPWIEAPPPQSATINALDAAVERHTFLFKETLNDNGPKYLGST